MCHHSKTFAEAQAICRAQAARLSMAQEIRSDCTINTGCYHDAGLV